jgi:sec-independent protein translocase protein TatA
MFTGLESPTHLLLVFLVVLLLFGAKRLPEIGRNLGSGIHGFTKALTNPDGDHPPDAVRPTPAEGLHEAAHRSTGHASERIQEPAA